ncbi:MAG: hypothetical protein FWD61_09500 [Phycisphaerales bacterium]|nr:hypothetical protein [Phycisphaerales bacterium]
MKTTSPSKKSPASLITDGPVTVDQPKKPVPLDIQRFRRLVVELRMMAVESAVGEDVPGAGYVLFDGKTLRDPISWNCVETVEEAMDDLLFETETLLGDAATDSVWQELETKH